MKLLSKERRDGRITKRYDRAQTPYQRVLNSSAFGDEQKDRLRVSYQGLDPVVLLSELERLQDQLWAYAHRNRVLRSAPRFRLNRSNRIFLRNRF